MMDTKSRKELEKFAAQIRLTTMREIANLGVGHVGGALSIADVLAVLYGEVMNYDPKNPRKEDRDWLVLSKGHAGPALYATLALKGFFPMEQLNTLNKGGTKLPSHCDRNLTAGIDITTGSLGQGSSQAAGAALAHKMDGRDVYTYLILGDGECNEGQVWEMALFANQFKLGNLIAFVDYNKQQLDGKTEEICDLCDVAAKFAQFGWHSQDIDGHDVGAIYDAIQKAKEVKDKPSMIVLNTVKGKGVSYAEGILSNHNMNISAEQLAVAEKELEAVLAQLQ